MRRTLLPILLILAGCGESGREASAPTAQSAPPSAQSASAKSACDLIDGATASAILGGPARGPIREGGAADIDQCQYIHDGARVIDVRTATVQALPADLATMQGSLGEYGKGTQTVAGVGDAAIWIPQMGALYVGRGARTLSFSVTAPDIDARAKSIELARAGLARM